MAQSVDWLSAGLRLQLGVHRKWSSDCQTGALDPKRKSTNFRSHSSRHGFHDACCRFGRHHLR
jgi:hypothetical protein